MEHRNEQSRPQWRFPEEYRSDLEEPSYSSEEDEPFIAYQVQSKEEKDTTQKKLSEATKELLNLSPTQLLALWTTLQLGVLICVLYYGIQAFTQTGSESGHSYLGLLEQQQKAHVMLANLFKN
eukprot:CAMPEP_0185578716 /NCGR_PEP_ID=MMETSP0434-20130131/13100_1 /TAXON_ID=626734 ORGANISM="Favella taraikaensis, Strain Fe Narragansett Bay" /NCGR_SAMPLE_ID=MMETSP0434 /ASSEMBLY_ACC=CAM_ASM_000379 /LENGTH=122 /DNA_ID=CAMNT_0028196573 /DNA_START=84 /DNA_END=452 /DNA_ORIENTATION=-